MKRFQQVEMDKSAHKSQITGPDIIGTLPQRGERAQLLLLYVTTKTERQILAARIEAILKDVPNPDRYQMVWIEGGPKSDDLAHSGLGNILDGATSLDFIPIGIAWRPKSGGALGPHDIRKWLRLVESDRRQSAMMRHHPERCAIIIGEYGTRTALKSKFDAKKSFFRMGESPPEAFADYVAMQAALTIARDSRVATGQTVKYPRFVHRTIWTRRDFQNQLMSIADDTGRSFEAVRREAKACLKELVPHASPGHIGFGTSFARRVCRLGYQQELIYDKVKMREVRELALTRPTVLVWTHKTHIDGFAILLATRDEGFPLVHLVGGDNMAFLGIGYLMRRSGTIFIRRTIDNPVYKAVMRFYISFLLEKRFPVSWALEGTRSRNGKLMPPRFGILKYVVEAAAKDNVAELNIVPISIYYDLIAELGDYAVEQTGATKRKESFAWFADYLRSLRKPLGRISLGIGEPVIVNTSEPTLRHAAEAGSDEFSIELQKLAFTASVNANAVTPITPSSLLSLILTGASPQALTDDEIFVEMNRLRSFALERALPLTRELESLDRVKIAEVSDAMREIGVVSRYEGGVQCVSSISEGKHFEASYYRNNAIHFFVTKAIMELSLLKAAESSTAKAQMVFWQEVTDLRDMFKFEFFYPDLDEFKQHVSNELNRINQESERLLGAGGVRDILLKATPLVSHAVLRPFAEAYSVIADVLLELGESDACDEKIVVTNALRFGKQAYLQRRITSEESIGKLMFSNGWKLAQNRIATDAEPEAIRVARRRFGHDMFDVTRRLRMIRELAASERARWRDDVVVKEPLRPALSMVKEGRD